ncbi:MAG: hypothetical protein FWC80_05005 [Firmicutes bacterium]|nr:hypothetical protein [Bacillota bacterium]
MCGESKSIVIRILLLGGRGRPPLQLDNPTTLEITLRSTEVIARSDSDEAIPRIELFTWDCFVANAPRNDFSPADNNGEYSGGRGRTAPTTWLSIAFDLPNAICHKCGFIAHL